MLGRVMHAWFCRDKGKPAPASDPAERVFYALAHYLEQQPEQDRPAQKALAILGRLCGREILIESLKTEKHFTSRAETWEWLARQSTGTVLLTQKSTELGAEISTFLLPKLNALYATQVMTVAQRPDAYDAAIDAERLEHSMVTFLPKPYRERIEAYVRAAWQVVVQNQETLASAEHTASIFFSSLVAGSKTVP